MPGWFGVCAAGALLATVGAGDPRPASPTDNAPARSEVEAADTAFWTAFNRCDGAAMAAEFTADVEFYHDKTGLTVGRAAVVKSMIDGPCGDPAHIRMRREAVADSERFTPLAGGFAMLSGRHRFLASRNGGDFGHETIADYVELWQKTASGWQMRRVISYAHRADLPDLRPVKMPAAALAALTGTYTGDASGPVVVTMTGDHLRAVSGKAIFDLIPLGGGVFGVADRWLTFTFDAGDLIVREEGKIVARAHRN